MCSPSASCTKLDCSITLSASLSDWGTLVDAQLGELGVAHLEQVAVGLGRQLVALGDAAHAGGEHAR